MASCQRGHVICLGSTYEERQLGMHHLIGRAFTIFLSDDQIEFYQHILATNAGSCSGASWPTHDEVPVLRQEANEDHSKF
jgi:hypothetical protein